MKDFTAKLAVKSNVKPKFCRLRSIPFALKNRVKQEIKKLQSRGILEHIQHGEYYFIIPTQPHFAIWLWDWNNGCCP